MGFAPEIPTTEALHVMHPLSNEGRQKVYEKRKETADALKFGRKLLAIVGPCAMTDDAKEILDENRRITEFGQKNDMVVLHRLPPWKPRTNPDAWHGLETTNPEEAHRITVAIAEQSGNLAMEFGHSEHIRRYLGQAALGWRGSRNDKESGLLHGLASTDPTVPLAIKNGMGGSIKEAADEAQRAFWMRDQKNTTPVVPIFRGGEEFRTPGSWMNEYIGAFHETDGRFILDVAHGSEQAYDPAGEFGKSTEGQLDCLEDVTSSADVMDLIPRGVMMEASDLPTPTDPVVPLDEAFEALERLASIHRQSQHYARLRNEKLLRSVK